MKLLSNGILAAGRTWIDDGFTSESTSPGKLASKPTEDFTVDDNFDEAAYLAANPDVAAAISDDGFRSGRHHYEEFGRREGRRLKPDKPAHFDEGNSARSVGLEEKSSVAENAGSITVSKSKPATVDPTDQREFQAAKARKLQNIKPLLRTDMPCRVSDGLYDFLTEDLRSRFRIVDTNAISSNDYDGYAMNLIKHHEHGWILDCGAGKRSVYYENVVNFEIVDYATTDVRGVGEVLPFLDNSFDAVLSIAVLEHVKDPFACAREIARVLKPGGKLMCCVPFLQPLHGYPHHYYNMTHQGLINLFDSTLAVDKVDVYASILPIWSLSWILRSWAEGLQGETRKEFLDLKISDLLDSPDKYLQKPYVKELSEEKNLELASATVLFAHKPGLS